MTAVVFVDVQNDFTLTTGALPYKYPEEPNHPKIVEFANECRTRGYQLYATADTHQKLTYANSLEGKNLPIEHCIEETDGHKLINGLVKTKDRYVNIPQCNIVDKCTFGSLTLLDRIYYDFTGLSSIGEPLERILICGYCTSICVISNALMLRAKFPNTQIVCMPDLCGDIDEASHHAAIKVMQNCMISIKSADCALGVPQDAA